MPSIEDLKPVKFKINIRGVDLNCSPLRLSHALIVAKIGEVFQDPKSAKSADIKQAQADMDEVIAELIPELQGIELDMTDTIDLITQLTDSNVPTDNKFLKESGVQFDDPKAKVKAG